MPVNQYQMENPVTQYPAPPFDRQPQDKVQTFGEQVPYGRPGQLAELASSFDFWPFRNRGI
jgi:hypothetical protein